MSRASPVPGATFRATLSFSVKWSGHGHTKGGRSGTPCPAAPTPAPSPSRARPARGRVGAAGLLSAGVARTRTAFILPSLPSISLFRGGQWPCPWPVIWILSADGVDGAGAGEKLRPEAQGHTTTNAPGAPRADLAGTPVVLTLLGPEPVELQVV